jgi:hypothetical protein
MPAIHELIPNVEDPLALEPEEIAVPRGPNLLIWQFGRSLGAENSLLRSVARNYLLGRPYVARHRAP